MDRNIVLRIYIMGDTCMIDRDNIIRDSALIVAKLMAASAVTAPKAKGIDNIVVKILDKKEELEQLAKKMEELAPKYGGFFARDADNVRKSDAIVLIGCKVVDIGVKQPDEIPYDVNVVLAAINLGIAIGSAVKTASIHNVDNRIMYTIGIAAKNMGLIEADIAMGIPLSIKGKNIYFDRKWPKK